MSFDTFYSYDKQFDEPFYNNVESILDNPNKYYQLQYVNKCDEESNYDPQYSQPCKTDDESFLISKDLQNEIKEDKEEQKKEQINLFKLKQNNLLNQIEHFTPIKESKDNDFNLNKLKIFIMCFLIGVILILIINIWFKIQLNFLNKRNLQLN